MTISPSCFWGFRAGLPIKNRAGSPDELTIKHPQSSAGVLFFVHGFHVNAAFHLFESHPATRARIGALGSRTGAWPAADTRISTCVQDVGRQVEHVEVSPNLVLGPVQQRVDLRQIIG